MGGKKVAAKSVEELLAALIAIPSVNPDGDPGTGAENCGEENIAQYVGEFLTGLGAKVHFDEVEPDRPNVIGHFPGSDGKPGIILGPHLDTVSVGGMTVDPFGAEIRDGKMYGRGACDTKGTMAAMLWALHELGPEKIADLDLAVTFAGFMGEETGQPGSRDFARRYAGQYAFALVGEPTGCDIVHKHKGTLWSDIDLQGVAVHGSTPELGVSAVANAAQLILALEGEFRARLANGDFTDEVLGEPSINIGIVRGGSRSNIVPAHCRLSVDMRVTPTLGVEGGEALLADFITATEIPEITIKRTLNCDPLDTPANDPFVQRLLAQPGSPQPVGAPWFCDAAILSSDGGIPAVAAGPGDIAQAHTADEWIDLNELQRGVGFYKDFLLGSRA